MTDPIGTAQLQLWNDLVSMIEQWEEDGADSPGDLARKIIAKVQPPIGTAQDRELIERLREADRGSVQRSLGSRIFGEAADALQSRIAEVGRLTERVRELEVVVEAAAYALRNNGYPETAAKIEDESYKGECET